MLYLQVQKSVPQTSVVLGLSQMDGWLWWGLLPDLLARAAELTTTLSIGGLP